MPLETRIKHFTCISMLNRFHNECYSFHLLPVWIATMGTLSTGCLFMVIESSGEISFVENAILLQLLMTVYVSPICFLLAAGSIWSQSSDLVRHLQSSVWLEGNGSGQLRKVLAKQAKTLKPFGVAAVPIQEIRFDSVNALVVTIMSGLTTALVIARE